MTARYAASDLDGQWRVYDRVTASRVDRRPSGTPVVDEHGNTLLSSRREARSLADDWNANDRAPLGNSKPERR